MKSIQSAMEITRASSKGQVVIPGRIRKRLRMKSGNLFVVTGHKNMIVLKKLDERITKADMRTLKLVEGAWKDLDSGRYKTYSKGEFFKEFSKW